MTGSHHSLAGHLHRGMKRSHRCWWHAAVRGARGRRGCTRVLVVVLQKVLVRVRVVVGQTRSGLVASAACFITLRQNIMAIGKLSHCKETSFNSYFHKNKASLCPWRHSWLEFAFSARECSAVPKIFTSINTESKKRLRAITHFRRGLHDWSLFLLSLTKALLIIKVWVRFWFVKLITFRLEIIIVLPSFLLAQNS